MNYLGLGSKLLEGAFMGEYDRPFLRGMQGFEIVAHMDS